MNRQLLNLTESLPVILCSNVSELLSEAQINSLEAKVSMFNMLEEEAAYSRRHCLLNRQSRPKRRRSTPTYIASFLLYRVGIECPFRVLSGLHSWSIPD